MSADRNLNHLYPAFRGIVKQVLEDMNEYAAVHMPSYTWEVNEGFRTAQYQNQLYQKGRTTPGKIVTSLDGYKKISSHQSSLAVDIVPKFNGQWTWNVEVKHWNYLGHLYRKHGLRWLGETTLRDMPHGEWPRNDKKTYKLASKWQEQNGLK